MFLYLHSGMVRMLREHISLNLTTMDDGTVEKTAALREQHFAIWEAIREKNPEKARQAMLGHIDYTRKELARRAKREG
jgi:GntR family transcriptional repressor for pyruvate dehydrogenase complex